MRTLKAEMSSILMLILVLALSIILTSCGKDDSVVDSTPVSTEETLLKIAEEDEQVASFDNNYNEDEAMEMSLAKVSETVYPRKVGQKMHPISKSFSVTVVGDSAYAVFTRTYEGQFIIVASTVNDGPADTIIYKPFTTQITRNIIYVKVNGGDADTSKYDWRIAAISLPEGGTANSTIVLEKLNVFLPNGDTIEVTSPNDYYLSHGQSLRKQIPNLYQNQKVTVRVELLSSHREQEFVSLTCNGNKLGKNRTKRQFQFVSSEPVGNNFKKVYEGYWMSNNFPGFYHAVVNALASQSVNDDAAPVESSSWGIPYKIN